MSRRYLEDAEAMALMEWANLTNYRGGKVAEVIFAIPNGGKRYATEAKRLKAMGVRAGIPDYFIHVPRLAPESCTPIGGMFLELKAGDNTTTPDQDEQLVHLAACGYHVAVARGWQEAARLICDYLGIKGKP